MKLASVVGVVALGACNRGADTVPDASPDAWPEYHIPLEIDVLVMKGSVHAYLNHSDELLNSGGFEGDLQFSAPGMCLDYGGDAYFPPVTCVRRAAFVGGGSRFELERGWPLGLPGLTTSQQAPDPMPDDFALEIEGCGSETARVPIDHAGTATPVIDVQTDADGLHVTWTSDQPWNSAIVARVYSDGVQRCHTDKNTIAFDAPGSRINVRLLESPVVTTGSWGVARVWAAASAGVDLAP